MFTKPVRIKDFRGYGTINIMDRLKVKDNKDLERDVKSNGIVNTNDKV